MKEEWAINAEPSSTKVTGWTSVKSSMKQKTWCLKIVFIPTDEQCVFNKTVLLIGIIKGTAIFSQIPFFWGETPIFSEGVGRSVSIFILTCLTQCLDHVTGSAVMSELCAQLDFHVHVPNLSFERDYLL